MFHLISFTSSPVWGCVSEAVWLWCDGWCCAVLIVLCCVLWMVLCGYNALMDGACVGSLSHKGSHQTKILTSLPDFFIRVF